MYIHEAVREAMKINGIIFRKSMRRTESEIFAVIKPSNSYETCQLIISRYGKAERDVRSSAVGFHDLAADDWNYSGDEL